MAAIHNRLSSRLSSNNAMRLLLQGAACCLMLLATPAHASVLQLQEVSCPATQRTFTAITELVFEGRSDFLTIPEGHRLMEEFEGVYNGLTESNCDSYFRRMKNLTLVNMTNSLNQVLDLEQRAEDMAAANAAANSSATNGTGNRRRRHRHLQAGSALDGLNETDAGLPSVNLVYEVAGTCRGCPLTSGGSFELYDDAFRRQLSNHLGGKGSDNGRIRMRTRFLTVQEQDRSLVVAGATNDDCQCVEGTSPDQARAPGVQECVDLMNVKLDNIRQVTATSEMPLYQNIALSNLLQLDDLAELVDTENSTGGDFGGDNIEGSEESGAATSSARPSGMHMCRLFWLCLWML